MPRPYPDSAKRENFCGGWDFQKAQVAASRRKALNDLGGATQIERPVMLTIIRIFLAYWFGLSILFMIFSLVMSGSAIIDAAVGLGFLMAIVLTLIQRWRR